MQVDEKNLIPETRTFDLSAENDADVVDGNAVLTVSLLNGVGRKTTTLPAEPITFAGFIAHHFLPEHVALKSTAGRRHYLAILKHVIRPAEVDAMAGPPASLSRAKLIENPVWPYLGDRPLEQITSADVACLIEAAIQAGYSAQTVRHIRNVIRSVFAYAIARGFYRGENPAGAVQIPESEDRDLHVLTLAETMQVLEQMRYPEREVALMAILTSMTISEICGLQWKNVNLTDSGLSREGITIPGRHVAIRTQWYRGQIAPVPASRRKFIALPPLLVRVLRCVPNRAAAGWNDFVLTTKSGRPINQINLAGRRLKRIGKQFDMPWLSWQVLRRTRLSILHEYEARVQEQLAKVIFPVTVPISSHTIG